MSEPPPPSAPLEDRRSSPEGGGPEAAARLSLIWALVAGFIPCLGLPVVWALVLMGRRKEASPTTRSWHRWLVALAVVDTLVALASLHMALERKGGEKKSGLPTASRRVLGVRPDTEAPGPGVRLSQVFERGPAATAGLRPGDRVHQANGKPIDSLESLQEVVRDTAPDAPVALEVEREGERWRVDVVPVEARSFAPPPRGLFEPLPEEGSSASSQGLRREQLGVGVTVVALLTLWFLGRRRRAGASPLGVLVALTVAVLGFTVTVKGLSAWLGGPSRGAVFLGMWTQTGLLLVAGWLLWRRGAGAPPEEGTRGWLRTYLISLGLLVTLAPRLMVCLVWLSERLSAPLETSQHPLIGMAQQGPMGALGWLLFAIPAALLAPVGEELVFRGALLPWLRGWMGRTAALVVSAGIFASLHPFYGVFTGWIFFLGLLLGWARLSSGGLCAPILLHVTLNSFAVLVQARTLFH
ncbi:type II CAAX prenyl endopeptidase Rce1 family protein [Hyalangium rubrum]|uniref:CPBP family glutamic-type intramembrane protease n=1 Tax=Hyalangium rubrum TaxID=3103134 RepID=A0ABU5H822_9BACT|nr:CPBP family glutamic-type intramembrane protease [Hyalangium sp. s54d21]MDY7229282.1 CPBP family glutamic-type intramembrane protease [Hyalangium sp. s54d21]